MDSVEESCQVQDPAIRGISVACIVAMLSSLEELCTGKGITEKYAEKINSTYKQMSTCDFEGLFSIFVHIPLKISLEFDVQVH
jgi:hypothetical protein